MIAQSCERRGFTVMEVVLSIGFLGIAAAIIGELAFATLNERLRNETRLAVIEWATNVLEVARARPWSEVTPEWASEIRLPEDLSIRLTNPKAVVNVDAERERPGAKRITVSAKWTHSDGTPLRPVTLVTVISHRQKAEGP
jgi:hypothetical protein